MLSNLPPQKAKHSERVRSSTPKFGCFRLDRLDRSGKRWFTLSYLGYIHHPRLDRGWTGLDDIGLTCIVLVRFFIFTVNFLSGGL